MDAYEVGPMASPKCGGTMKVSAARPTTYFRYGQEGRFIAKISNSFLLLEYIKSICLQ